MQTNKYPDIPMGTPLPGRSLLKKGSDAQCSLLVMQISFAEPLGMGAELDPPDVKQSIAWDLACKVVRQRETEIAEKRIQNSSGSDFVRDVQV